MSCFHNIFMHPRQWRPWPQASSVYLYVCTYIPFLWMWYLPWGTFFTLRRSVHLDWDELIRLLWSKVWVCCDLTPIPFSSVQYVWNAVGNFITSGTMHNASTCGRIMSSSSIIHGWTHKNRNLDRHTYKLQLDCLVETCDHKAVILGLGGFPVTVCAKY